MTTAVFDTLKASRNLKAAGVDEVQADAIVTTMAEAFDDAVATKADIAEVKAEVSAVKVELKSMATKADVAELKADVLKIAIAVVVANVSLTVALIKLL